MKKKLVILDIWWVLFHESNFIDYFSWNILKKINERKTEVIEVFKLYKIGTQTWIVADIDLFESIWKIIQIDWNTLMDNHLDWIISRMDLMFLENIKKLSENYDFIIASNTTKYSIDYLVENMFKGLFLKIFASCYMWTRKPNTDFFEEIKNFTLNYNSHIFLDDKNENILKAKSLWINWMVFDLKKHNLYYFLSIINNI